MSIYFIPLIAWVALGLYRHEILKNYLYWSYALLLFLISSFRYDVGIDFQNYKEIFENISSFSRFEPLSLYIFTFAKKMSFSFNFALSIFSFLTIYGIFKFFRDFSIYYVIGALLFFVIPIFYFQTFNHIRQWAAIGMMLLSTVYFFRKNNIKFLFFAVSAPMLHFSAFFFYPLFFIYKIRLSVTKFVILLILSVLLIDILFFLILQTPYGFYIKAYTNPMNKLYGLVALLLLFNLYFIGYFDKKIELDKRKMFICSSVLVSCFILIAGISADLPKVIIMRLNEIFIIFYIPFFLYALEKFNSKSRQVILFSIIVLSCISFYRTIFTNGLNDNLVPYSSLFFL